MTMTLTPTRKLCSAWSKKSKTAASEMYECSCKEPSDKKTLHITDTSELHTLCNAHVCEVVLPYKRTIDDEDQVCKRCRELERLNLKRERLRVRGVK